ncbi:hypothetical protein CRENBAI_011852 [Crenichthys baileyi]|uniref:Uncharacterized protein n=1 Tax=Crenichthys baileyi TaxID=28760 RepID=A0AAV9RM96_9TELE
MPPQPPPRGATRQTTTSTVHTMEPPTQHQDAKNSPARSPWPAAPIRGWQPPPRPKHTYHTAQTYHNTYIPHRPNIPQHRYCNDSPGRNNNQLSSTITALPVQMPVTPHPKRGHNPPTPHDATPPPHPPAHCPDPPLDMTASGASQCQARPTIRPTPGAPARQSMREKHEPAGLARQANLSRPSTTRQPPQCRHKTCSTILNCCSSPR